MNLPPLPDPAELANRIINRSDSWALSQGAIDKALRDYGRACARAALDAALAEVQPLRQRNFNWASENADLYRAKCDAADYIAGTISGLRDSL